MGAAPIFLNFGLMATVHVIFLWGNFVDTGRRRGRRFFQRRPIWANLANEWRFHNLDRYFQNTKLWMSLWHGFGQYTTVQLLCFYWHDLRRLLRRPVKLISLWNIECSWGICTVTIRSQADRFTSYNRAQELNCRRWNWMESQLGQ